MMKFPGAGTSKRPKAKRRSTALTLSADDLNSLARVVAAGQVFLQARTPVATRLKAALTRMGLPTPQGL